METPVKSHIAEKQPKNIEELKEYIKESWYNITKDQCKALESSFKKRAYLVFRAKGGHTKY